MEERSSNEINSEVEMDLPDNFTTKIINIIQNKQQESQPEEYVEEEDSEPESEIYQPPKQNNCKKSGKKIDNRLSSRARKNKDIPSKTKYPKSEVVEQNSQSSSQQQSFYTPRRSTARPKSNGIPNKQITKDYKILKDYFQDFLTKMLTKMEDATNKQLKILEKRIQGLQSRGESASLSKKKSVSFQEQYMADKVFAQKRKKHRYIKTWAKLQYIDKIERGDMSIRDVSKQLKIKEGIVQSWIANKQKLQAINNQKKNRKADRESLDSQCLDVD